MSIGASATFEPVIGGNPSIIVGVRVDDELMERVGVVAGTRLSAKSAPSKID